MDVISATKMFKRCTG